MLTRSTINNKRPQSNGNDTPINLRTVLIKYNHYWPLFVFSIAVAMMGAFLYQKYVQPVYEIMATLEIQDSGDSKPAPEKSSLVDFQQLDQVNAPRVVENEMEILKSNQIIKQVVDYFQLWAGYKLKGGIIKDQDLYGITPVKIHLVKYTAPIKPHSLKLQLTGYDSYTLTDNTNHSVKHRFSDTVTNEIGSWSIAPTDNLKQYIGSEIEIDVRDPELTVLTYQNSLSVESELKPATVINISVNDKNIKRGQDFVNYLIYFYKQAEVSEKNKIAKNTLQFIDDRLDSLSGQLDHAENKIEGYRSQNELTDVNAQSQMYLQQMQINSEKLNDINIQLNIINKLDDYLNQPGNSTVPSTQGITDQHLVGLVQKLSDVQLEKNKLLATLPEKNPAFEPLNSQIASLKNAIKEDIKSIKSSMLTTQQSLQGFKSNVQTSIKNVPVQEHQLAGMGRLQSNKETLYKYLLQQREQISLTYASSPSNVRLVDAAHILPLKSSKKYIPYGLAFLIGLIFPVGFIYGKNLVKNVVNDKKDVEFGTGVPVLTELSLANLASPIVFDQKVNNDSFILIEQFRQLRSRLTLLHAGGMQGTVTMITSSAANEGKSFVSTNLGISLANASKKTVLVELDIYKPKISKTLGIASTPGLTSYLKGKTPLEKIIQTSQQYPDLSIVPSGDFIDDFSELLDQERFSTLVEKLRSEYDYILFDTPPVHTISDALALAKYCDNTFYVVRYDQTSRSLLPFIQKLRAEELLPEMNIILNGLPAGRDSEGYKYENYYKK